MSDTAISVTVIGGYLGAGKTTLVNHLIRQAGGRRLAILVNEFGALPIDQDLIVGGAGDVIALAGGCVCCSYGDDLVAALMQLAERGDAIDHVVLELSGVALPGGIARALSLIADVALDGVVVLVDAVDVRAKAADPYIGDTITRQIADADVIVINKCDALDSAALLDLRGWLADAGAGTPLIATAFGAVDIDVLIGASTASLYRRRQFDTALPHRPTSESFALAFKHRVDADRLAIGLADAELGLVRAKGIVCGRDGVWQSLQVVGRRYTVAAVSSPPGDGARLVAITHGRPLDRRAVAALVDACRVD